MSKNHNLPTKYDKKALKKILQNKLLCLMTMDYSVLLTNSYPNNCSETPNCLQNLWIIMLKNCRVSTQWALVPLRKTKNSTIPQKHQTATKNFENIFLEKLKGMNPMGLIAPLDDTKDNNSSETTDSHQNLEMIALNTVNHVMMKSETTQLPPSPQLPISLWGKQVR